MSDEPTVDEALWFVSACRASGGNDRHFLIDNPHTFRGRMSAWCRTSGRSFAVSKHEMIECSEAARIWVAGFLCGNEPPPPLDPAGEALPPDDPAMARWVAEVARFRETGVWIEASRACARCDSTLLRSQAGPVCDSCAGK